MPPCSTPDAPKRIPFSRRNECDVDSKRRRIISPDASASTSFSSLPSVPDQSYLGANFITIKALGEGDFGVVKEVQSRHSPDRFALKTSKVDKLKVKSGLNYGKDHINEVRAHSSLLPHPHLLQFHQAWKEDGHVHMLLELCEDSLDGYWRKMMELTQNDVKAVLKDMLTALNHLSSINMAHLDVKPGNILRTEGGVYKLADFSVAVDLSKTANSHAEFGDGRFAAPELLNGVSVPASAQLTGEEWKEAKGEGRLAERVEKALSGPFNLKETVESMLREHSARPSAEDLLSKFYVDAIEFEFEDVKSVNNILRDSMRRMSLSPMTERELRKNKSPLMKGSEYHNTVFHTDPAFYEIQKPLRQRVSMEGRRAPRRPLFD